MTVHVECSCGAELSIDDASELACTELLRHWYEAHDGHRRTVEEYRAQLDAIHRRTWPAGDAWHDTHPKGQR